MNEVVKKIKSIRWDNRVQRHGFLQPKAIISDAETLPVRLSRGVTAKYDNVLWVNQSNLYDEKKTESFQRLFARAFAEDKKWPLAIMAVFFGAGKATQPIPAPYGKRLGQGDNPRKKEGL